MSRAAEEGFGSAENVGTRSSAVCDSRLYVGTVKDAGGPEVHGFDGEPVAQANAAKSDKSSIRVVR